MPSSDVVEVVLVQCILVDNQYQKISDVLIDKIKKQRKCAKFWSSWDSFNPMNFSG